MFLTKRRIRQQAHISLNLLYTRAKIDIKPEFTRKERVPRLRGEVGGGTEAEGYPKWEKSGRQAGMG